MNLRFLTLTCLVTAATLAADAPKLPSIRTEPIAKKRELLFSDDFERADPGKDKSGPSWCRRMRSRTAG